MTIVMCFGTFDLLHLGHIDYFKQAKRHGDRLIVVVARDSSTKDKDVIFTENERKELLSHVDLINEVVLGYPDDHFRIIEEKNPDVICLGYDHPIKEEFLKEELEKRGLNLKILRMKPYMDQKHKSSKIRDKVLQDSQ